MLYQSILDGSVRYQMKKHSAYLCLLSKKIVCLITLLVLALCQMIWINRNDSVHPHQKV